MKYKSGIFQKVWGLFPSEKGVALEKGRRKQNKISAFSNYGVRLTNDWENWKRSVSTRINEKSAHKITNKSDFVTLFPKKNYKKYLAFLAILFTKFSWPDY